MAESFYVRKSTVLIIAIFLGVILIGSTVSFAIWANYNTKYGFGEIVIRKDSDFANRYDLPGSGTINDPYLITNLSYNSNKDYAIYIIDTTSYFVIKNCTFKNQRTGIYIRGIGSNTAKIQDCDIQCSSTLSAIMIFIFNAPDIIIRNNNLYNMINDLHVSGIEIRDSQNVLIANNSCSNFDTGIRIHYCDNSLIEYNYVELCYNGIRISDSHNSIIRYNTLFSNSEYGIRGSYSYDCVFHHNSFINNGFGGMLESQAYDTSPNIWYDISSTEGNFWSDLIWDDSANYTIAGYGGCVDLYPLQFPVLL